MKNLPEEPIRRLVPSSGQARLLAAVRSALTLPGAPLAATARYISSYYDDNRIHDERVVAFGIGPKGGRTRISPLLRAYLHDAAFAFGDGDGEGSEDLLLFLPGATLLMRDYGGEGVLSAIVEDPDADPARGFHGMPGAPLPVSIASWLTVRMPAADASAQDPDDTTRLVLRPDTKTWVRMSAHQRLEHYRLLQADADVAAWIDSLPEGGCVLLERVGRIGFVSIVSDAWSGKPDRRPLHLLAL